MRGTYKKKSNKNSFFFFLSFNLLYLASCRVLSMMYVPSYTIAKPTLPCLVIISLGFALEAAEL